MLGYLIAFTLNRDVFYYGIMVRAFRYDYMIRETD